MNFSELQSEVTGLTKRADLLNSHIIPAIKRSTLKLHQKDFFPKDLYEVAVTFPTAAYEQSLDYMVDVSARWRALKYVRKIDSTTGLPFGEPLKVLSPEQLLDDYGVEKTNVCYEAGLLLQIKTYEEVSQFLIGCYVSPDVTDAAYSSWIATLYPYAIVYESAAVVFTQTGDTERATFYRALAAEESAVISINAIQTVGY
jgi:hypothetical protein